MLKWIERPSKAVAYAMCGLLVMVCLPCLQVPSSNLSTRRSSRVKTITSPSHVLVGRSGTGWVVPSLSDPPESVWKPSFLKSFP